ncbi:DUF5987 family protein [Kitasatospora sp. NPDC094015]|uniref:DUF5987 family protein n=1 Tax=Kitasatospora sp. NPDC094015 TaxID=3155205 RepID=UPI003332ECE6
MTTDRRAVLKALAATAAVLVAGAPATLAAPAAAAATDTAPAATDASAPGSWSVQTLEAFADTLVPGQRRFPGDRAVAGAVTGPGAVEAGAVAVLSSPDLPLAPWLPEVAALLDAHALAYAAARLILLPPTVPPFVGLSFTHRTGLVGELTGTDGLDRSIWQVLALLVSLAFDTAAQLDTAAAVRAGHPGLTWLDFPAPGPDGLWRFPDHSYGAALAPLHPATTPSGSPA